MGGLNTVHSSYNINNKKNYDKLTFEVGEDFLGKIIEIGENNDEVLVRRLDGWKFTAKLEEPLKSLPRGTLKFEVEGFEGGKLKLKIINEESVVKNSKDGIEEFLNKTNLNVSKKDYILLENMVKHNIPLTKNNISYIKNILDFKCKFQDKDSFANFIKLYLNSKGIDIASPKAENITKILKNFMSAVKELEVGDILTLYENNTEINEENMNSFVNIFKKSGIYNEVMDIKNKIIDLKKQSNELGSNKLQIETLGNNGEKKEMTSEAPLNNGFKSLVYENSDRQVSQNSKLEYNLDNNRRENTKLNKAVDSSNNRLEEVHKEIGDAIGSTEVKAKSEGVKNNFENNYNEKDFTKTEISKGKTNEATVLNEKNTEAKVESSIKLVESLSKDVEAKAIDSGKNNNISEVQNKDIIEIDAENTNKTEISKETKEGMESKINTEEKNIILKEKVYNLIKREVAIKTDEIKTVIKDILNNVSSNDSKNFEKILGLIKDNINDFKMYNSLSNQYYCLDLPINLDKLKYECKLFIKDDRNKGKKIDTKHVKIATSIKTINLGIVDAFIKVDNNLMDIEIKSSRIYTKAIDKNKDKLLDMLKNSNYNVYIKVSEKINEFNLPNCREFFQDTNLAKLDIKV
ncbi:hypothetical protein ACER0A_011540 [Haloimpatiens sp. FM7315]|uniref:hypothetical protein n=1 Tax=Haloimpatiens sp. FM7315 TaxID=3298609 RepID=UPI00370B6B4D